MEQNPARAMIAMSGGVDSAVAALLLRQAGYDCIGATMRLYRDPGYQTACERRCCSDTDEEDAAFVCAELGIPHESVCLTKRFAAQVIDPFVSEYTAGLSVPAGAGARADRVRRAAVRARARSGGGVLRRRARPRRRHHHINDEIKNLSGPKSGEILPARQKSLAEFSARKRRNNQICFFRSFAPEKTP